MSNSTDKPEENMHPLSRNLPSHPADQIVWTERKDVYGPMSLQIDDFTRQRGIPSSSYQKVFFAKEALETLISHLDTEPRIEQGGILFGNAYEDSRFGIYVEITAAVPAPQTIGTVAHLEFTPDSWLSIMNYATAQHSSENLVGWYHSHPNHGVFMSSVDMRTQAAFFSHPWCLSVVFDPIRRDIGYFLGGTAVKVNPVEFSLFGKTPSPSPESLRSLNDSGLSDEHSLKSYNQSIDFPEANNSFRYSSKSSIASKGIFASNILRSLSLFLSLLLIAWNTFLLALNHNLLQVIMNKVDLNLNHLKTYNFWTVFLNIFAFIFIVFTMIKGKNEGKKTITQKRRRIKNN